MMIEYIVFIIIGMCLLIKGADFLVEGASNVAEKFHIPEIIIGLTIVSIGTSMPELVVSLTSGINGYTDMAIGNVIGSNIANLMLILGVSAILHPIRFRRQTMFIEIPICIVTTIVLFLLGNINSDISKFDGILLLALLVAFISYTIIMARKESTANEIEEKTTKNRAVILDILSIIVGVLGLKFGGDLVVDNAVEIAKIFNWSEKIIGITILAIGTSLPELVTSVSAALKGKSDIALGNVIGSNIFNILLILSVSSIIRPMVYNPSYNIDMLFLLVGTIILFLFPRIKPKCRISRANGVLLVTLYISYITFSFLK